jgi:hypothetical protein
MSAQGTIDITRRAAHKSPRVVTCSQQPGTQRTAHATIVADHATSAWSVNIPVVQLTFRGSNTYWLVLFQKTRRNWRHPALLYHQNSGLLLTI